MSVKIEGLGKVLDSIQELNNQQDLSRAIAQACALVERSAKQKCPADTGELRRSITSEVNGTEGIIYTTLEYAPYIEFGTGLFAEDGNGRHDVPWHYQDDEGNWHTTSGIKPHPFMRPALEENRQQILDLIQGANNNK